MTYLENSKQYTGSDLENIFFRPMLTGESAQDLGVRVLYNMPQPTHVQLWDGQRNILQKFTSAGWAGGKAATKYEKTVNLNRVKAELGFSAANYSLDGLREGLVAGQHPHGRPLGHRARTGRNGAFRKQALAENIRVTTRIGDTTAASGYNTFGDRTAEAHLNGLVDDDGVYNFSYQAAALEDPAYGGRAVRQVVGRGRSPDGPQGRLDAGLLRLVGHSPPSTEKYSDAKGADAAYADADETRRRTLAYHGIPVVDVKAGQLPRRHLLPPVVRHAHRPPQPRAGRQHGRHARQRGAHVVQPRRRRRTASVRSSVAGTQILDEALISFAYKQ